MRGFTLVEAVVALTVSTLLVLLAGNLFLVQGDFYGFLVRRAEAQDNARSISDVVSSDLRSIMGGGLVVADSSRLVIRRPITLGGVCAVQGTTIFVHLGGADRIDPEEVSGFAIQGPSGGWRYFAATWESLYGGGGAAPARRCFESGADTTGAVPEYFRLNRIAIAAGRPIVPGEAVLIYAEREFRLRPSSIAPRSRGLFVGPPGDDLVEFASGLDSSAGFSYRVDGRYRPSATGAQRNRVEVVRINLRVRVPAETIRGTDATVDWVVDVPLRRDP